MQVKALCFTLALSVLPTLTMAVPMDAGNALDLLSAQKRGATASLIVCNPPAYEDICAPMCAADLDAPKSKRTTDAGAVIGGGGASKTAPYKRAIKNFIRKATPAFFQKKAQIDDAPAGKRTPLSAYNNAQCNNFCTCVNPKPVGKMEARDARGDVDSIDDRASNGMYYFVCPADMAAGGELNTDCTSGPWDYSCDQQTGQMHDVVYNATCSSGCECEYFSWSGCPGCGRKE